MNDKKVLSDENDCQIEWLDREHFLGQTGCVVWLTGYSASGKSTVACALAETLRKSKYKSYVLDGDVVRRGLNSDLGFSPEDRRENIRRVGEVAAILADAGLIAIVAFISPYRADRERARLCIGKGRFIEVYVSCPLDECERRDPKQMYRKAREGLIPDFTGVSAPYEEPERPVIVLDTSQQNVTQCAEAIARMLKLLGLLRDQNYEFGLNIRLDSE